MKGTLRLLVTSFTFGILTLLGGRANAQCPVVIDNVTTTNVTCNGANDGTICITVSGGFPNYTYQIFNGPFFQNFVTSSTSHCFTGLGAGVTQYLVQVIAENGVGGSCGNPPSLFVTITDPPAINVNVSTTPETCPDSNDGTATANVVGGVAPFTFSWLPLPDVTQTVNGLDAGPYSVTVTDANNCTATENFTITSPPDWSGTFTPTPPLCNGGSTGSIASSGVTGATPPYTFLWNPSGLTTENISNIPAGSYTLTVTDNVGCTHDFGPTVVTEPAPIVITSVVTNVSCAGLSNGGVNITVSGGTGPYTFSWSNGPTTEDITNVPIGPYTVTVTDANGCTQTHTATVNNPTPIVANATVVNATCNAVCNGSISLAPTGGTGPYTFTWSPNVSSTSSASNLCAGTYDITITDALGCSIVSSQTVNDNQISVTFNPTPPTCAGLCNGSITAVVSGPNPPFSLSWSPGGATTATINNLCAGQYTLSITDGIGCTVTQQTTLSQPTPVTVSSTVTPVSCNGGSNGAIDLTVNGGTAPYTFSWTPIGAVTEDVSGLSAGSYSVSVSDANGCSPTPNPTSITVPQPTPISITSNVTDAACGQCNGAVTVTPSGGTGPYTFLWATGQTTNTINNLCAGVYQVNVTDATGCVQIFLVPVNNTDGPTGATVTATNASCFGQCNGSATVTPIGGTAPYTFNWVPGGFTTSSVNNLCAGTYNVQITDANGCTTTATVNITQPQQIQVSQNVTGATCGQCNGAVTLTPSGAPGPFTFVWSPNVSSTNSASNLCPNNYSVTVTAANGCSTNASVSIINTPAANLTTSSTPVSCNGGCNGSATVSISGGNPPFTVQWNDPGNQTGLTANNLCAGNYTVTVTDVTGCVSVQSVTVAQPQAITLSAPVVINEVCQGQCNGSVSVSPTGGTLPYTFLWNNGASTPTISGLCPGVYTVTITDANGCTVTSGGTVLAGGSVSATATPGAITCNGLCNGSALATPVGGTAPYSFVWDDPNGQTLNTATLLCPGTYNVTVTDANGCTASASATVTQPAGFTLNRTSTPATCGQCDGTGTVTVSGGGGPFTFLWSTGQTTSTVNGLCAGVYTVVVTNAAGCSNSINVLVSSTGGPTSVGVNVTNVTCFGQCNGAATANPQGGTPPYSYVWVPGGQTTQSVSGLCAGQYQVQVTDANGCSFTRNVNIQGPSQIVPNQTVIPANCGQCNGSITLAPSGGTGPYSFSWNTGATTASLTNLCAGQYTVTITDANNCTRVQTFSVGTAGGPNVIIASTSNSACSNPCSGAVTLQVTGGVGPFTTLWSNGQTGLTASGLCAGDYLATVTGSNGCATTIPVTITQPVGIVFTSATTSNNLCPGTCTGTASVVASGGTLPITYTWNPNVGIGPNVSGLCVGSYTVTATDANGCTRTQTITISDPQPLNVTITPTQPTCSGTCNGQATAVATGGTAPYTFLWNDPAAQTTATATGLCAGTFTVTITDANGCTTSQTITLGQPQSVTGTTTVTNVSCNGNCNGSATVVASGGTPGYTFLWNDPANQSTATAVNLCPGTYSVQITDANGCVGSVNATIGQPTPIVVTSTTTPADCGVCNGAASAVISGGVAPYTLVWSNGQTTPNINGLCAGVFSVEVTDANGCVNLANVAVNNIGGATSATVNSTGVSCFGVCDGTASVSNPVGGTAPYTFLWVPGGQTSASISNVCAGNYFAQIIDADGCIFNQPVTVPGPSQLQANAVSTSTACGVCNGSITIAPSGGVGPYTVSWSNGSTGLSLTNLCAGAYTVTITDATGCVRTQVVPVNSITGPTVNITGVNPTCASNCNGSVSVAISGATPPYQVTWQPGGQTGTTLNNVCAGTYTAVVTDSQGCVTVTTTTLTSPAPLSLSTSFIQNVACGGQCTGSATVVASGGNLPYTFAWSPSGGNGATANNLCAGNYTVTVTDASGCTQTTQVVIVQPQTISVNISQTNPSCFGLCNGSATASASGGTAPYTFQWNLPGNPTTPTVNNLCAGSYVVTVTDANNCQQTQTVTITQPSQITGTVSATNITCNGDCNSSATVTASGGSPGYTFLWNDPSNQTTGTALNLCPGSYSVTITDSNGCSGNASVNITQPSPLVVIPTTNAATCGQCNGSASVSVSGGLAPYSFVWGNGQTASNITGLCAGVYTVQVTDAQGCSVQVNVSVGNSGGATSATVNATPVSCFGQCNGTATVTPVGGVGPFTYLWVPGGQTTQSVSGLCAGSYNVQIIAANGCIFSQSVTIGGPSQIVANAVSTSATCGVCNGAAVVSPSGGTGPYSVSWSNGSNGLSLNNLCAGVYTATITDAAGCTSAQTVGVNSTAGPQLAISGVDPNCHNGCNGSATVTISGGTAPYQTVWSPGSIVGTTATGLCAGTYAVAVTDNGGCISTAQVTLDNPSQFALSTSSVSNIQCFGQCNGTATVIPSGGTVPYSYNWLPSGGNQATATGLCANTYNITATDAAGCTQNTSVTITEPAQLVVGVSVVNPSCGGVCDGSVTANITGGVGPYTIQWNPFPGGAGTVNNVCAGNYSVTVTDANNCSTTLNFTVTEPPVLNASITATTGVLCIGSCTGTATVTPSGGTGPYTYAWNPTGQVGQTATGLCVGSYVATVTDAIGCQATATALIDAGQALNATVPIVTQVTCNGACDGTATAFATGGVGPYSYQWNDPANQTGQTATGLCPGTYTVTVTDSQVPSCSFQATVTIIQPAVLTVSAVGNDVSCGNLCDGTATAFPQGGTAPYTFLWNFGGQSGQTATNLCVGNYTVTVTDFNGCSAQASVSISGPPAIVSNATTTASTCSNIANGSLDLTVAGGVGAYSYNWQPGGFNTQDLTNVLSGVYTVVVTDATGCSHTATYTVGTLIQIDANAGPDVTVCQYTPIVLQGSGGGIYLWSPSTGLSSTNIANPTVTPIDTLGITYTLTVTIGNCTATDQVTITALPVPVVDAGPNVTIPQGGSVALNSNGIVTPWNYQWSPASWLTDPNISNPVATPQESITYYVTVTDVNGCSSMDSIRIEVVPGIVFPDGITPNGDGINDTWRIDNIQFFPDAIVEVYNRWGQMLFQSAPGYPIPWDGRYNGNDLPVGTYYYVIHSSLLKDAYTGPITIVR